jgi:hypothetical protein
MLCARDKFLCTGEYFDAPGIIFLCASKNNYSSKKKYRYNTTDIHKYTQIIHRIIAAKQGIIPISDQYSNITK